MSQSINKILTSQILPFTPSVITSANSSSSLTQTSVSTSSPLGLFATTASSQRAGSNSKDEDVQMSFSAATSTNSIPKTHPATDTAVKLFVNRIRLLSWGPVHYVILNNRRRLQLAQELVNICGNIQDAIEYLSIVIMQENVLIHKDLQLIRRLNLILEKLKNIFNLTQNKQTTLDFTDSKEVFIPADGDCFYTSVFVGYLLLSLNNPIEFNKKLYRLTGKKLNHQNTFENTLWQNFKNVEFLKGNKIKILINLFKKNMGIDNNLWGGANEIKKTAQKLNIKIQECIHSPEQSDSTQYVKINNPEDINSSNEIETLYILKTNPHPSEVEKNLKDPLLQNAQEESALASRSLQHFRLLFYY